MARAQSALSRPAPGLAGDLQNLANPNAFPLSPVSRQECFPLRGQAVIALETPSRTPAQPHSAFQSLSATEDSFPGGEKCCWPLRCEVF